MKRFSLVLLALLFGFLLSQRVEAQQVCGPDGCYDVQFQPVRSVVERTVSVLDNVTNFEQPPVPVTYSVQQFVANRAVKPIAVVRQKVLQPVTTRVRGFIRRLICR